MEKQIQFVNHQHEAFYKEYLPKCRWQDTYHSALVYCLGISEDTRRHIDEIYDFETGWVKPECLHSGWQTSGSVRVVLLAFHLYNDGTSSVFQYEGAEEQMEELRRYLITELFCCGYAPYFWQAIRLRFPEYCGLC